MSPADKSDPKPTPKPTPTAKAKPATESAARPKVRPTKKAAKRRKPERFGDPELLRAAFGGRPVGPHLQLGAGLLKAADRAVRIGATAIQVFVDNPTSWRRKTEPPAQIGEFRRRLADAGIGHLAVHASYLVNLASPAMSSGNDRSRPWWPTCAWAGHTARTR